MKTSRIITSLFIASLLGVCIPSPAASSMKSPIVKTGWNVGAVPAINYDTDLGFQFGGLGQLYHYGDGSLYPNYLHKFQVMAFMYSKGAKELGLSYDSKYLIPGMRVTAELKYRDTPLCGFYGFNGAVAPFYSELDTRKSEEGNDGISFYSVYNRFFKASLDLQGRLAPRINWIGGLSYDREQYGDTNLDPYKGEETLYHQYVQAGLISSDEASGGNRLELKGGIVYDTRDFEPNPERGIYATATLTGGSHWNGGNSFSSLVFSADFRQYVSLVPSHLTFAYDLSFTTLIAGRLPFYSLPSFAMRGTYGRRIVGDGIASASADLRYTALRFAAFRQNIEVGLVGFGECGRVVRTHKMTEQSLLGDYSIAKTLDGTTVGPHRSIYDPSVATKETLHSSVGGGFFFSMNKNFISVVEIGHPLRAQDGAFGVYVNLGFSF